MPASPLAWWGGGPIIRESLIFAYFHRVEGGMLRGYAGVAQLVEHNVANVVVVGSNPITRSGNQATRLEDKLCRYGSTPAP